MLVKGHLALALYVLMDSSLRGNEVHPDVLQRLILFLPLKHREMLYEAVEGRNAKVVNFNPTLTALRGCNTAIYYISTGAAAKSAMFTSKSKFTTLAAEVRMPSWPEVASH